MKLINKMVTIAFIIIILAVPSVLSFEKNPTVNKDDPKYFALIIGIEKFENWEHPVQYCEEDANSIFNKLRNSKNWCDENIKLLLNKNATKERIKESITIWLDDLEDEKDTIVFYYSGHGSKVPILFRNYGNAYFFPYDISNPYYSDEMITDKELDQWMTKLESKHILIIFDCCYAGRMKALSRDGRVMLTAGGKILCPVDEDVSLEHGIFTYFLLQGLDRIGDLDKNGWVSAEEAFFYAGLPTFWYSFCKFLPFLRNGPQIPFMYDKHKNQLLLIRLI